jgi:hypothetical protein
MDITSDLKRAICSLFEVHADECGVRRIVTPLEYQGINDQIIIRVRPHSDGFVIDENGETSLYASLNGGDIESEAVERWAEEISLLSPVQFTDDERIIAFANSEKLVAPYAFRVAEAAQQLFAIATSRCDRQVSDFKERVKQVIKEISVETSMAWETEVELPIAGGLKADHVLGKDSPLIIITATSATRLLEAEVIYMQYRAEHMPGFVLAVAENQSVVGKKQYERAAYYTNRAVIYNPNAFRQLIVNEMAVNVH